jgi:putative transposase
MWIHHKPPIPLGEPRVVLTIWVSLLSHLLKSHPCPRAIVTDKLKRWNKPIKHMCSKAKHLSHKRLNNRVKNAHQLTRRKEKSLIKFKSPSGV